MIWYLPLEHIDNRYTKHLDEDICNYLENSGKPWIRIYPDIPPRPIRQGSFLDAPTTIEFKSQQIARIAKAYATEEIQDGDMIFTSDIWFPGLESIAYLNYFCSKVVELRGFHHAGSFTDTDFVRDMERWGKNFEDVIFDIADTIFVASQFIKSDVAKKRIVNRSKLVVTGLPLDKRNLDRFKTDKPKQDIVIFNGRNVDEKQPWLFKELEKKIKAERPNVVFANTQEMNLPKEQYYELLARSKVVVSFALQENFGFGVLEAAYVGCIPCVPDRLVYPEFFGDQYLYKTFEECVEKVKQALDGKIERPQIDCHENCVERWFT